MFYTLHTEQLHLERIHLVNTDLTLQAGDDDITHPPYQHIFDTPHDTPTQLHPLAHLSTHTINVPT